MSHTLFKEFLTPDGNIVLNGKYLNFQQPKSVTYVQVVNSIAGMPDHIVKDLFHAGDSPVIVIRRQNVIADHDTLVLFFDGSTEQHLKEIYFIPLFDDVDCDDNGMLTDDGFTRKLEESKESIYENLKQSESDDFSYEYSKESDQYNFAYIIKYDSYEYSLKINSNKEKKTISIKLQPGINILVKENRKDR